MAAGNHHAAAAAFVDGGEIKHGGGDHADIEDVDAAVGKTALDVFHQFGTAQASVASECDAGDAFFGGSGGDGFADKVGGFVGQGFADNASDVVGFEDVAGNICHDGFLVVVSGKEAILTRCNIVRRPAGGVQAAYVLGFYAV